MVEYEFVETEKALTRVAAEFETRNNIAVDLEADSMFHFREKVCLIQMASKNLTVVIDPLQIENMSSLKPVFANPAIRKIFHGSDYDIRSLHRDYGFTIHNLFDTELASRFLGISETGLSSVIENRFCVKLDKSFQKIDWSQRPLSKEMIEYGARDVIHLLKLAEILDKELEEKKRAHWVREECDLLSLVRVPEPNGEPLFLRVKGAGKLDRRSLGVLESLLQYRVKIAEKKDRPLFKIFGNSTLLELSKSRPCNIEALKKTRCMSFRQIDMFGNDLVKKVIEGMSISKEELPKYPRKKKPVLKPEVPKRVRILKEWRDKKADELKLDPPILFNKSLLTAIAVKNPSCSDDLQSIETMKNWQRTEFGKDILSVLNQC